MRLWEQIDTEEYPETKLFFVQGIVPQGIAPVIQPPKEVDQTTTIADQQEALISFFTTEKGADAFRKRLVKRFGYKDRELTVTTVQVIDVMDLVRDLNADLQDDLGICLRAEVYYVRNDIAVIGDVLFSETIAKN